MELPDDVLSIVSDFSRPVTRPDWRRLHRMFASDFHKAIQTTYNEVNLPVLESFVRRYDQSKYYYRYSYHGVLYLELNRDQTSPIQITRSERRYGNDLWTPL
jgi:hypothetical protein